MMQLIGQRVRMSRKAKNLTIEKTAEMAGTSAQFLFQIEKGNQCMSSIKLARLAKALNVTTDFLLFGSFNIPDDASLLATYFARMEPFDRDFLAQSFSQLGILLSESL